MGRQPAMSTLVTNGSHPLIDSVTSPLRNVSALSLAKVSQKQSLRDSTFMCRERWIPKRKQEANPELSFATSGTLIMMLQNKARGFVFREGCTNEKNSSFLVRTKN